MVRLTIPALHSFRDLVLSAVSAAIDAAGGDPSADVRDEIVSALSEAFNNVVLHAYRGVRGGTIEVHIDARPSGVEIRMLDRGRSFEPLAVPAFVAPRIDIEGPDDLGEMDLDRLPESGMGLFIMRSFMDDVSYQRGGHGKPNVLTLRKSWDLAASGVNESVSESANDDARSGAGSSVDDGAGSRSDDRSRGHGSSKKESSQSGWRMRSVAVPSYDQSTAGSLKRK